MGVTAQQPLGVHLPDTADFDTFHPGPNAEALSAVRSLVTEQAGGLFLWGPSGSGKTHLLQAACRASGEAVMYVPLRDMANESPEILEGHGEHRLLCLDDVDAVAGKSGWERALVGRMEMQRHRQGRLLCAGSAAPAGLGLTLNDLVSRLVAGTVQHLESLRDPDRVRALQVRARARGLDLPDAVATYLLTRSPRDMHALMALLDRLDAASMAAKRRLTVPFVREVLELGEI